MVSDTPVDVPGESYRKWRVKVCTHTLETAEGISFTAGWGKWSRPCPLPSLSLDLHASAMKAPSCTSCSPQRAVSADDASARISDLMDLTKDVGSEGVVWSGCERPRRPRLAGADTEPRPLACIHTWPPRGQVLPASKAPLPSTLLPKIVRVSVGCSTWGAQLALSLIHI